MPEGQETGLKKQIWTMLLLLPLLPSVLGFKVSRLTARQDNPLVADVFVQDQHGPWLRDGQTKLLCLLCQRWRVPGAAVQVGLCQVWVSVCAVRAGVAPLRRSTQRTTTGSWGRCEVEGWG